MRGGQSCSGTPQHPGADPGNLCVFEVENSHVDDANAAEAYGAAVYSVSSAAGKYEFGGSWAVTAP
jgi:hypothetical protein